MKIVIVGCGKVGYTLAETLNEEGHELTVIDSNEENLMNLTDNLDVMCYTGNGSSYRVLNDAGIKKTDLLIAVTNKDEINLLSCLIAKKAGNCRTIARVRHPEYYDEISFISEELGLFMAINPELAAATDIFNLIRVPSAMEMDTFAKGMANMVKLKLPKNSPWIDKRIKDIPIKGLPFLVAVIDRNGKIIIPNGNTIIKYGDNLFVVVSSMDMNRLFNAIGVASKPIKDVIIAGGGTISYYLAKMLLKHKIKVKIIVPRLERCNVLNELLDDAIIIHGDPTNQNVLLEEGIEKIDAFVSITDHDEENIMLALFAGKYSNAKLITKVDKMNFERMIYNFPLGSIISPKMITAEEMIRCVRSMQNAMGSNVESVYKIAEGKAEALEFIVKGKSKVTDIPLKDLNTKPDVLICTIIRNDKIIIPLGNDVIMKNDRVIIATTGKGLKDLEDIVKNG
ncbi:MAG: Trk system potassium transporter TrkA [Clostridiales bacterium]|nr:Trk system potassium transporter TrkA [Clostridiales bacterium]